MLRRVPSLLASHLLLGTCHSRAAATAPVAAGDPLFGEGASRGGRALQVVLSEGDTVVNGVLNLFTTEGVAACEQACVGAFSAALGVEEALVGCLCPSGSSADTSNTRRRSLQRHDPTGYDRYIGEEPVFNGGAEEDKKEEQGSSTRGLRGLAVLDESEPVAFAARVSGGLDGGTEAVELLSESMGAVASAFGIQESEMEMSTLTVTPPSSGDASQILTVISDFLDASDIAIVSPVEEGVDWAGGARGVALFLALLVLIVGTVCPFCVAFGALWKAKNGGSMKGFKKPALLESASFRKNPAADANPRRSPEVSGRSDSPPVSAYPMIKEESESSSSSSSSPGAHENMRDDGVTHGGDEAAGGGAASGRRAPKPSAPTATTTGGKGDFGKKGVETTSPSVDGGAPVGSTEGRARVGASVAAGSSAAAGASDADEPVPSNVSMEESGGKNPLFKTAAVRSAVVADAGSPVRGGTPVGAGAPPVTETPGRSRLSTFLGNASATPARLRKLAGRMASKSPAPSTGSRRSRASKGSATGSSKRNRRRGDRKHRRQGTFPGAYSQRNSSELDHQRPPADPVYTFMIKTIAGKGYKFMTTTEIAFCAMRMYSHFRRTEGNYNRLTVMQNAENIAPVYEIIWQCDGTSVQNPQGVNRFFSITKGTDAEQQKSLLACLLALSWDRSATSCRSLERALTPTRHSKTRDPEDVFWDEFKEHTDALSGDDEMVVVARVVLLIAGSVNHPGSDDASSSASAPAAAEKEQDPGSPGGEEKGRIGVGIEHGHIMKALSGSHLRDVGNCIKEARPGWQEAHVQLVSVLLVIAYLEEGAKNAIPGGPSPDPLSSLEWVSLLAPEALDSFLVEKLEARRVLVELDLEPSGLVIKHDDDGEVECVEPAAVPVKPRGGHSWVGPRGHQKPPKLSVDGTTAPSSGSSVRKHRHGSHGAPDSASSSTSKPSPVVITTVNRRISKDGKSAPSRVPPIARSSSSVASADSNVGGGSASGTDRNSLPTIAQLRTPSSYRQRSPSTHSKDVRSPISTVGPAESARAGSGSGSGSATEAGAVDDTAQEKAGGGVESKVEGGRTSSSSPGLTIDTEFPIHRPDRDSSVLGGGGLSPAGSQASSAVTRVYAASSVDEFSRAGQWVPPSEGLRSPLDSQASPKDGSAMSQVSIAASRFVSSPLNALGPESRFPSLGNLGAGSSGKASAFSGSNRDDGGGVGGNKSGPRGERPRIPSAFSETASEAAFSEAASRFDNVPGEGGHDDGKVKGAVSGGVPNQLPDKLEMFELGSPTSAAGSRFDSSSPSSAVTFASRVGVESPTAAAGGARGGGGGSRGIGASGLLTGRSTASSMRSDAESSFFRAGLSSRSSSHRSVDSRGGRVSPTSGSSWDEEDLQNIGTRWLADRAYNQQFDEKK